MDLKKVKIYDNNKKNKLKFAKKTRRDYSFECIPCDDIKSCIKDGAVVLTTTPIEKDEWIHQGIYINAIGAYATRNKNSIHKSWKKQK